MFAQPTKLMKYKVVPFNAAVSSGQAASQIASQVESIITREVDAGWEYVGVHQLQTFRAGSAGCFGLGATPPSTTTTEFVVFRQ
jgi:ribulose bisphosphate carboxylase small subunit